MEKDVLCQQTTSSDLKSAALSSLQEKLYYLLKSGFTEEAIAQACKVNQSTISRILGGKIRDPRNSLVVAITQIFEAERRK